MSTLAQAVPLSGPLLRNAFWLKHGSANRSKPILLDRAVEKAPLVDDSSWDLLESLRLLPTVPLHYRSCRDA